MANYASIINRVEGIINNEISSSRGNQGAWEWHNALQRIVSQNRFTGTARVYGPTAISAETEIESNAVRLFGILVDNSMAAEDGYVAVANLTAANWTAGTSNAVAYLWAPRNAVTTYVFPGGLVLDTAFTVEDILGTEAGLEAGTGTTSGLTVVAVYTE
jgi:hypothetical protein